jgi:hypothetical protein
MSYDRDSISQFCSAIGKPHSSILAYCSICKSGLEIVNIDSSPPPDFPPSILPKSIRTIQPIRTLPIAAIERENVNARIRNTSSRPHAGTNALSGWNSIRTTPQLFSFSVILVLEEFCYSSLEDEVVKLQTVLRRKVHSMLLYLYLLCIVRCVLILIRCYFL